MKRNFNQLNKGYFKKYIVWINFIFLFAVLVYSNQNRLNNLRPLTADSIQNATYSYNLAYNGIFSLDGINPSYHREPLLPFIHSVYISYFTNIPKGLTKDELVTNLDYVEQLSRINIFYLSILFFSIWYLVFQIFKSHIWVIPLSLFSFGYFAMGISFTISQLSEVPAVIMVNIFTGLLISIQREPKVWKYVILGITLGLLAILKAVFFYVGLGFIILFFLFNLLFVRRVSKELVKYSAVMTICFGIMVIPWMLRNLHYFSDFSIAERGGTVLLLRAVKNQMTDEEFKGGFYAWASEPIQTYIFEPITDYSKEDLMNGGRLRRFTRWLPEDREFYAAGKLDSIQNFFMWTNLTYIPRLNTKADSLGIQQDVYVKDHALNMIFSDIPNHFGKSILFFWRGIWFYEGKSLFINFLLFGVYVFFWWSIIYGWVKMSLKFSIVSLLPLLYLVFHIFITHNLPRYSYSVLSILVIIPFYYYYLKLNRLEEV